MSKSESLPEPENTIPAPQMKPPREAEAQVWSDKYIEACKRIDELEALINRPHTDDFLEGIKLEAAHQKERYTPEHDGLKSAEEWVFLFGWLAGKATQARKDGDHEKAKHHAITAAAALYNWHAGIPEGS